MVFEESCDDATIVGEYFGIIRTPVQDHTKRVQCSLQTQKYFRLLLVPLEISDSRKYACVRSGLRSILFMATITTIKTVYMHPDSARYVKALVHI